MNCIICGEKAGFGSAKLQNGKICKCCAKKLPSLMIKGAPYLQEYTLKHAMEYEEEKLNIFNATASYGKLHLDEMHGLFCIANSLDKNGKPKDGNNIFAICDLTEVGLYCKSPRADRNNVLVDIEFRCTIESPRLSFSTIIKKGTRCHTKRVDSQHVEWEEPKDMSMFRTLFNQTLSSTADKINHMLFGKTVYEFEIEKARAIFMLPTGFTANDLKKARRLMMKVYHPDTSQEDITREAQIINSSYTLLMSHLEREGLK
jgi:hypothetical protein